MTDATTKNNSVLVVGAGIAGMAAAMHLAELSHDVQLLDAAPAIGGSMHLLDHTFPTNSCGICLMLPHQPAFCPTLECEARENVHLLPYAEAGRNVGRGARRRSQRPSATKPATWTPPAAPAAATAPPSAPRRGPTTTRAG